MQSKKVIVPWEKHIPQANPKDKKKLRALFNLLQVITKAFIFPQVPFLLHSTQL